MAKEIMEGLVKTNKGIVKIVGYDGATFVPHISDDYVLSWTNDRGLENPDPVQLQISKGEIDIGEEEPKDTNVLVWIDTGNVSVKYRDPETGTFTEVQSGGGTDDGSVKKHNVSETAHNDIRLLLAGLSERLNAIADSDDTTLDQLSEIVAYIKANKTLIESVTTSKVNVADIVDNLTTNVSDQPLSAKMGVELRRLISTVENSANNAMSQASSAQSMASSAMNHASSAEEIASSAMQRASSAEQMASAAQTEIEKLKENGVPGGGTSASVEEIHIGADEPTDGEKLWIDPEDEGDGLTAEDVKNAMGYTPADADAVAELSETIADLESDVERSVKTVNGTAPDDNGNVDVIANIEPPKIVSSVSEMTDTDKQYVLQSTGTIWANKTGTTTETVENNEYNPSYTTGLNLRLSTNDGTHRTGATGRYTTDYIEITQTTPYTVTIKGLTKDLIIKDNSYFIVHYFDSNKAYLGYDFMGNLNSSISSGALPMSFDLSKYKNFGSAKYVRITLHMSTATLTSADCEGLVINFAPKNTVETTGTATAWTDTGISYAPTFKTDLIGVLGENNVIYLSDNALPSGTYILKSGNANYDTIGIYTVE